MKRRSAWEVHLRTGRWVVDKLEAVETKFNPNHDPKDGRFTFAGQGMQSGSSAVHPSTVMRSMGLPVDGGPKPEHRRPRSQAAKPHRQQQAPAASTKLKPVPGYPDTGADSWRAANDQVFIDAAKKFNSERGLKPGDPKYIDPQFIKAWAMV
jgi:hypothetical protein